MAGALTVVLVVGRIAFGFNAALDVETGVFGGRRVQGELALYWNLEFGEELRLRSTSSTESSNLRAIWT